MKLTVGKLIWGISIFIFVIMSYNENIFDRALDIFNDNGSNITYIQEFISSDTTEIISSNTTVAPDMMVERLTPAPSLSPSIAESDFTETNSSNELLFIEIEKLKWKQQQYEDKLNELEIKIEAKSNRFFDDMLALVTTMSPLLVPIVTTRYHKKQINIRNKSS